MTGSASILDKLSAALADKYAIEREIGAGGMATVYLAQDIRHRRKVAIKVLHPELTAVLGPERFLNEIELTANLQHPHILPLFDSGAADTLLYYVMPYVQGETLRTRLTREQQLPIAEAVRIASDVADALEYAHKHGVVHRDIKPENVLLHDGRPLVADFGIALAVQQAGGQRMTQTGMSLGTPQYMAPEQAMGDKSVDHRADIYALGAITYEMLTGEPPFTGPNSQAVVAKILTTDPSSLVSKRRSVPPHVESAVLCALEKMPADRFASAAQFAEAMAGRGPVLPTRADTNATALASNPTTRRRVIVAAPWALAGIALAVASWALLQAPEESVTRQRVMLWQTSTPIAIVGRGLALSPDGNTLVFVDTVDGRSQLWIKERDQLNAAALAGTVGARAPVFSPDGEWLAFLAEGKVKKVPRLGGSPITIADSAAAGGAMAWLDDGTILFNEPSTRLRAVSQNGGPQRRVFPIDSVAGTGVANVTGLPGGHAALITICTPGCTDAQLAVLDVASGKTTTLAGEILKAWYVVGDVVFVRRDGGVFAVPFDLGALKFAGAPVPILDGVRTSNVVADMAVSSNGTLMYIAGAAQAGALVEPVWVDRRGQVSALDSGWSFVLAANGGIAISPDGRRLAVGATNSGTDDIWIKELERGPLRRLTFDGANARPTWSRDGLSVIYTSIKPGGNSDLRTRRANGTGAEEIVADLARSIYGAELTPDSATLIVRLGQAPTRDIALFRRGGAAPTALLASNGHDELTPALSPDGRWLAYSSDESGNREIYVRPFPDVNAGKWQVSRNGGTEPLWSRSGRELFFRDGAANLISAAVALGPEFVVTGQATLFSARSLRVYPTARLYDVAPGDGRFIFLRSVGGEPESVQPVIRVENWIIDIKNALRGKR